MVGWSAETARESVPVLKVTDRVVIAPLNDALKPGQNVLIVRENPDDEEPDVIANGKVALIKDKFSFIRLDVDTLKKRPEKKDRIVLLGAPKIFSSRQDEGGKSNFVQENIPPEAQERGYIQLRYLHFAGQLDGESSTEANRYKNISSLPKTGWELEWFLDFLSSYGLSFGQLTGVVPIQSYYHNDVQAQYAQTYFKLMYRTQKKYDLRGQFFLQSQNEEFSTQNPDDFILSTKTEAQLLGAALIYEPGDLLLRRERFAFQWSYLKLQAAMSLNVQATDGAVSRGTSSGGSAMRDLRLEAGATMWIPSVPWVKRYTLSLEGFHRQTDLKFSGPTRSENGGVYAIPENGTAQENETGWMLSIGVRFDDVIGAVFKPKD